MTDLKGVHITTEAGNTSFVPCVPGKTSDGYHSIDDLYSHRNVLFCALLRMYGGWKSRKHHDGSMHDGWFIAGMSIGGQPITYHLPDSLWALCFVREISTAPEFDGHSSNDVVDRIVAWLSGTAPGLQVNSYRGANWYAEGGDRRDY